MFDALRVQTPGEKTSLNFHVIVLCGKCLMCNLPRWFLKPVSFTIMIFKRSSTLSSTLKFDE